MKERGLLHVPIVGEDSKPFGVINAADVIGFDVLPRKLVRSMPVAGALLKLRVLEQRHEAKVHVQLLVTVKERESWIVGREVELELLEAARMTTSLTTPAVDLPAMRVNSKL
jgi:hypothetical protein